MKKSALLLIVLVFFAGCIEYEEELWLNKDGSGRMVIRMGIETELLEMTDEGDFDFFDPDNIKAELNAIQGIKLISSESILEEGVEWIEVDFEFSSMEVLELVNQTEFMGDMIGDISLSKDDYGNMLFSRTIDMSEGGVEDEEFIKSMFEDYEWKYTLHLPGKIVDVNVVNAQDMDIHTNSAFWSFNMYSVTESPQTMEASFEKSAGGSTPILLFIGGVVLTAAIIVIL